MKTATNVKFENASNNNVETTRPQVMAFVGIATEIEIGWGGEDDLQYVHYRRKTISIIEDCTYFVNCRKLNRFPS